MDHKKFKKIVYVLCCFLILYMPCCLFLRTPQVETRKLALEPIRSIYQLIGLPHDGSLESINEVGQQWLLRPSNKERSDLEKIYHTQHDTLINLLRQGDFIDTIYPSKPASEYCYLVILGAREKEVQKRIEFACGLLKHQSICAKIKHSIISLFHRRKTPIIVLLSSSRPLNPELEDISWGATEAQMMQRLIENSPLAAYPQYPLINVPMKINEKGELVRPNTDDTIVAWLATNPEPGDCLVISSQPFVQRQEKVMRTILPTTFSVTGVGSAADTMTKTSVYLDELARTIYQEKKLHDAGFKV